MEAVFAVLGVMVLNPMLGVVSLCYALYLLIRKRPAGIKMMFLKNEDVLDYTKREASIFVLWGVTIIAWYSIQGYFINSIFMMRIGITIAVTINVFGYYLRRKNEKKYISR